MSGKRTIWILSVLLAALAVIFFTGTFVMKARGAEKLYRLPLFPGMETDTIDLVLISNETETLAMRRGEEGWLIEIVEKNYPADSGKIEQFLELMKNVHTKRLVSEKPEQQGELNIDRKGKRVSLTNGDGMVINTVYLGTVETSDEEFVISDTTGETVYTVEPEINFYLERDGAYWSELSLFSVQVEKILKLDFYADALQIQNEGEPLSFDYALVRGGGEGGNTSWSDFADGKEIEKNKIDSLLNAFNGIRGERFFTGDEESIDGDARPLGRLEIETEDGIEKIEVVERLSDNEFLCDTGKEYRYVVQGRTLGRIFKDLRVP